MGKCTNSGASVVAIILIALIALSLAFILSGCGGSASSSSGSSAQSLAQGYPYKLKFNVTDVFFKEIGSDSYAVLTFDLSNLDKKLSSETVADGDLIYVKLFNLGGYAEPLGYTTVAPNRGIFAEARVAYVYANSILVSYDFDTIKLPSTTSRDPSTIVGATVLLSTNGTGMVNSLIYRLK